MLNTLMKEYGSWLLMDKNKLTLYYKYFIPITILQSVTSILMMSFYSVEDYGLFILYLTSINFFFFLTIGVQNGYTILIKDGKLDRKFTAGISSIISVVILGLLITSIPILYFLNIDYYWKFAFISALTNVVYIFHKSIFRVNIQIHSLNLLTLFFRSIFLIDIIIYTFINDIYTIIILDTALRLLLVLISTFIVLSRFKVSSTIHISELKLALSRIIAVGSPIMVGNWLITIYIIFDKTLLSNDPRLLGLYSFAITSVLLIRVLLIPLSELMFVTINTNETIETIINRLNLIWKTTSSFVLIAIFGAYFIIDYIGLFNKYVEALPALLILLNILPLSISLDIYIYNLQRRYDGKKFLRLAFVAAIISFGILFVYDTFYNVNLVIYAYLVYITYLSVYFIFVQERIGLKVALKFAIKHVSVLVIYSLLIYILIK